MGVGILQQTRRGASTALPLASPRVFTRVALVARLIVLSGVAASPGCDRGARDPESASVDGANALATSDSELTAAARVARARELEARGLDALAARRHAEAIPWLEESLELDPSSASVVERLLECLIQEDALESAIGVASRYESSEFANRLEARQRAKIAFLRALGLERLGRAGEAEAAIRRSLDHFPRNVASRFLLARVLASQSRHAAAIVELRGALAMLESASIRAGRSDLQYQLARSLQALGQNEEAAALFVAHREARERELTIRRLLREAEERPESIAAHVDLARASFAHGDTALARRAWSRAFELDASRLEFLACVAVCLAREADCEGTRRITSRTLEEDVSVRGLAHLALAICALGAGDRSAARSLADLALREIDAGDELFLEEARAVATRPGSP